MAEQKNTTDGERSSLPASPTDENAREAIEAESARSPVRRIRSEREHGVPWRSQAAFVMPLLIVLSMALGIVWVRPVPLPLKEGAISHIGAFLGVAMVISLFLERAIEVFISVWRNPDAVGLDVQLERAEQSLKEAIDSQSIRQLQAEQAALKIKRARYKVDTQTLAMWVGFFSGLLISVAGLRCLEGMVKIEALTNWPEKQQFLFRLVDVLLTGGLLAGGSEGLHKVAQVYTTFMDTTNRRLRGAGQPTPPT
jgi:hypothetical protein